MSNKEKVGFSDVAAEFYKFHPQEVPVKERLKSGNPITVGIPRELSEREKRVTLRPEAVSVLTNNGVEVRVETRAGHCSKHEDKEYSDAGAQIAYSTKEVFESDIILKVAPPTIEEIGFMKPGKTIISALQRNVLSLEYIKALNQKQATALAYELIQDKVGGLPLVRAMSEIAGSSVMLIAAELLSSFNEGLGVVLGGVTGVPPTKVLILGAGTVAEYAARAAIGLGAEVKIFDNHIYKLRRIKEKLGYHGVYTSTIDTFTLSEALRETDVAIGAIRSDDGRAPCVVTEEMVGSMKPNSVIIDVSIDQGGCFETSELTTHLKPTFRRHGVIHYCVPNVGSRAARTATTAISNIFTPILLEIESQGGIDKMLFHNPWFAKGVYTYRGGVTNESIAKKFEMPCKNLNLIISAHL